MANIYDYLEICAQENASDMHVTVGVPPILRKNGAFRTLSQTRLGPKDTEALLLPLLNPEQKKELDKDGQVDFAVQIKSGARFRTNIYHQKTYTAAAFRLINSKVPNYQSLGLPEIVTKFVMENNGLVLVTGATGSGKSTSLAAMLDFANKNRNSHIITIEDPIEFVHSHNKCIVNQREVGRDTDSFASALRAALREDPDIIQLGEMRDYETISTALTAAETGHLVLSTLHTTGVVSTIDRMIDVFPASQQQQARVQLSMCIKAIMNQRLIPRKDGIGRVAAIEIMVATPAIKHLIREGKTHQIYNTMITSKGVGMKTMDNALAELYARDMITMDMVLFNCNDEEYVKKLVTGLA